MTKQFKVGEHVKIQTPWADKEFPNCTGRIVEMTVGNQVALVEPDEGQAPTPRRLHISYLT